MLFIVHIVIDIPDSVPAETRSALIRAEGVRAAELARAGVIIRLWRDARGWANWGLWQADDEEALVAIIGGLPLRTFMTVTPHPVVAHPSDPQETDPHLTEEKK